jgi:hypothetical protein
VRSRFLLFVSTSLVLVGCMLDRSPLDGPSRPRDAGSRQPDASADASFDAGPEDSGVREDSGVDAGRDAGTDAGSRDAGPGCTSDDARCDGSRALTCTPTGLRAIDCAALEARCVTGAAGPVCEAWTCRPSSTRCSADGTQVLACDALGTSETASPCVRGCASGSCRPRSDCERAIESTLTGAGTLRFSLCGGGNDDDYVDAADMCNDAFSADGEDRLVRLELDRRRVVHVDVVDSDPDRRIDPAVYVRRRCGDPSSQVACADDGSTGLDTRLVTELDPGEHFLVIDSFDYSRDGRTYGCGSVTVTVTLF